MKIKNIKLYGFKSFPEESNLALNAGITAFVGPNGSGKSNIFDALRWVFGEQSMKALRCERIEDLIYISPDAENDAHFTEVSVTIDNEDYFPQFGGELEIKRRFYRSGESEFYLNRVKCRLADIQALFLNSGALTYSFLELSEIEKIIHGDTKQMFDDVSGILKYQERREQTRRRLEATEQDLLRLEDIIHEMQRSLRSLRRQVRQTKLFRELRDEMKSLTLYVLKHDYDAMEKDLSQTQSRLKEQEGQRQSVLTGIQQLQKQREDLKHSMAHIEAQKQETLEQVNQIASELDTINERIAEKEKEAQNIILSNERTVTSIKEKENTLIVDRERIAQLEGVHQELEEQCKQKRQELEQLESALKTKDDDYFSYRNKVKSIETSKQEYVQKVRDLTQHITKLQYERDNKGALLSRIRDELHTKREELESELRRYKELEGELDVLVTQQEKLARELEEANHQCQAKESSLVDIETDLLKRQESLTECKVMIDTLQQRLLDEHGVKEIKSAFGSRYKGLFRENMEVAEGYEAAVDICLGDMTSYHLIEEQKPHDFDNLPDGRFGFVLLDKPASFSESRIEQDGVIPLDDKVTLKDPASHLAPLISMYYITPSFEQAIILSQKYPMFGFVTEKGLLVKHGIVVVEKGEVGYFMLKQSLDMYKEKMEGIKNQVLFTTEQRGHLQQAIDGAHKDIESMRGNLFSENVKKSEYSLKHGQLGSKVDKVKEDLQALEEDEQSIEGDLVHLDKDINEISNTLDTTRSEAASFEKEQLDHESTIKDLEKERHDITAEVHQKRLEIAKLEERLNNAQASEGTLRKRIETISAQIDMLKQEEAAQILIKVQAEIDEMKAQRSAKSSEKARVEQQLPEQASKELAQKLNEIFDKLDTQQKQLDELQNQEMQLKYESFQLSHKRDETYNKAREEFHIDLRDYAIEEEIVDPSSRLMEVKGKLEKLGEVNPLSLDLYEKEKQRLDEFLSQRDDIIAAKRNLLRSIDELDTRARDRFVSTFSQVKEQFNFVFSNFFEGGHADLVLSDANTPLTSKIDIVVRMKGKRVKKINQLSGGERTLLAISLLLAFYLVKPAPFCILDEIDAPLDDANVVRFNRFLRDLSQRTQVVIITHNRATMEYADYLYGLTMEKPGQSKIISARLADLEQLDTHVQ